MQHAGAVAGAAHARVGDAHHVAHALLRAASSGSAAGPTPACPARPAARRSGARAPSRRRRRGRDRRCAPPCRRSSRTRRRGPVCCSRRGSAAGGLMTAPSGARLPRSTARPSAATSGLSSGRITSSLKTLRAGDVLAERAPVHRRAVQVQVGPRAARAARAGRRRRRSPPSGTRRTGRMLASTGVSRDERVEARRGRACTPARPRHRDQVDDRVGRAAEREHGRDRVVERRRRSGCRAA